MPPPRPNKGGVGGTPMSERQQMALLIQMTATTSSSEHSRSHLKKNEHKKSDGDMDGEINSNEKPQEQETALRGADNNSKTGGSTDESNTENTNKKDISGSAAGTNNSTDHSNATDAPSSTSQSSGGGGGGNSSQNKRNISDIDEDDYDDCGGDDVTKQKKKRKDSDSISGSGKDATTSKSIPNLRLPARIEKNIKQTGAAKNSPTSGGNKAGSASTSTDKEQTENGNGGSSSNSAKSNFGNKTSTTTTSSSSYGDNDGDAEDGADFKITENIYSGSGLKVPPLKIVIPQQNCSIDTDGNVSRTGKINASRNAALPYVVSSSPTYDRAMSPHHESPIKISNTSTAGGGGGGASTAVCSATGNMDEKQIKLLNNEEKNLHRVLRSSHRTVGGGGGSGAGIASSLERSSNNSSPQMQSSSPSPASSSHANEACGGAAESGKISSSFSSNITTSPQQTHTNYEHEQIVNLPSPSTSSTSSSKDTHANNVELHPRKRKIRSKNDESQPKTNSGSGGGGSGSGSSSGNTNTTTPSAVAAEVSAIASTISDTHPHDFPFTNCFQMYLNIRRQIEKKWKNLSLVKPRPPQGYNEYLINKRNYLLSSAAGGVGNKEPPPIPSTISSKMREIFVIQERERQQLFQRHTVEREKLCLNVEQEIIRVHSKAARNVVCQSAPFSVCTLLKDAEVYNVITPEQEEKDRNARYRFNGRLLLSWLQDVDDKWEKIKESMVLRHHNEAESLHAVQLMDWEIALKKFELCDYKSQLVVEKDHVPIVHVSDDFDLLPA